jgi:hypothetical protein
VSEDAVKLGTGGVTQPVAAPLYQADYLKLLTAGILIDRRGLPLGTAKCGWSCGGLMDGFTCPLSLPCPLCHAQPSQRCRRPSGHAADPHIGRLRRAGAIDRQRKERGDPTLPAPWPDE